MHVQNVCWRTHTKSSSKELHNITQYVSDLLGRTKLNICGCHSLLCPYFILGQMDIKQGHRDWLKSCYSTWLCLIVQIYYNIFTLSYNAFIDCYSRQLFITFLIPFSLVYVFFPLRQQNAVFIPHDLITIMLILTCFLFAARGEYDWGLLALLLFFPADEH